MDKTPSIEYGATSVIIKNVADRPIKIPSAQFPLNGPYRIISPSTTSPFDPDSELSLKLLSVFDGVKPRLGKCYDNTQALLETAQTAGIRLTPYTGWLFVSADYPIHHCFAMLNDHLLDLTLDLTKFSEVECEGKTTEELREMFAAEIRERALRRNSETMVFGQCPAGMLYIAAPCDPAGARQQVERLLRAYPRHPSWTNTDSRGRTPIQRMLDGENSQP